MRAGVGALEVSESTLFHLCFEFGAHGLPRCMVPLNSRLRCRYHVADPGKRQLECVPKLRNGIAMLRPGRKYQFILVAPGHRQCLRLVQGQLPVGDGALYISGKRQRIGIE